MLIRYVDDAVLVFEEETDARRVLAALPKRSGTYGLTLHPEKTRLVPFERPRSAMHAEACRGSRPGTFNFLGFTHYWGTTRKGGWAVKRKTTKDRFRRALQALKQWCWRNRHLPIRVQWQHLSAKRRGHLAYCGIIGDTLSLRRFRYWAERVWRKWLRRRTGRVRCRTYFIVFFFASRRLAL